MDIEAKILIIDDEEIVLDSCTEILANGNYQIATAINGTLGLELVNSFRPDLAIVDLKMPGISGFEVLEKIHEFDPTIVTIVITGYATISSAVEAMKKGAYDFLPKPFTPDELRLITRRGLEKRKLVLDSIALRKEKEMLREHFAAIVSHELKSPLTAVQQNLFILADELSDKLNQDQKDRLERIKKRIDDLINIIHTWLRVITVDPEKLKETFKSIDITNVINKAIESVQPHANRKNIKIITTLKKPLSPVMGDEGTLTEVLVNIINNAVKYSHIGDQVSVQAEEKENNIIISVSDTGIGIPKEDLPFIFNDFFTGTNVPREDKGSGLGLAITKRIIQAHDGLISVKSELGKGSTFIISLPVIKPSFSNQLSLTENLVKT